MIYIRKRPVLQVVCAGLALLCSIVALSIDEMSDGDVKFFEPLKEDDFLDEVDYDCGWKSFRVNYIYYDDEDTIGTKGVSHYGYESYVYEYSGDFCKEYEIVEEDFCTEADQNGKLWLTCGIVGILLLASAIPVVWYRGKASVIYVIVLGLAVLILSIGTLNWMFNDNCEDIEQWENEDASLETGIGSSLIFMFVSIFFGIIGILISSIHLMSPAQRQLRQQRRQQNVEMKSQPRIQTHVVN